MEVDMETDLDRISNLPSSILASIVSCLPTKLAVSTSVLSQRWRYIWSETPNLDFDEDEFTEYNHAQVVGVTRCGSWVMLSTNEGTRRFIDFVRQTLLHYQGHTVSKFRLRMTYCGEHFTLIDQWIRFAMRFGVQDLELDFSGDAERDALHGYLPFDLQNSYYLYESLRVLKLKYCYFNPPCFVMFQNLNTLCLVEIEIRSETLLRVITSCVMLKVLQLQKCSGLRYIRIPESSSLLESLTIYDCFPLPLGIIVRTLSIRIFKYIGHMVTFQIQDMPHIREAELDFQLVGDVPYYSEQLGMLMGSLNQVKVLTVGSYTLQVLPEEVSFCNSMNAPLYNVKHLTLDTELGSHDFRGIAFMLRLCPELQTLVIENSPSDIYMYPTYPGPSTPSSEYWEVQRPIIHCLSYIKSITITGFTGRASDMALLKYLFRSASVVEKVTINIPNGMNQQGVQEGVILMTTLEAQIMAFPKVSGIVQVLVNYV